MSQIVNTDSPVQVGCMYLEANGVVGYHQAVVSQLLLILEGEFDTTSKFAMEVLRTIPFPLSAAWVTFQKHKK